MSYPIRCHDPKSIYFVTNRTIQGRLLLRPSKEINDIIGGVLAAAVVKYSINLYAFVFASNHFHMMIQGDPENISRFMGFFQSEIAQKLGPLVDWAGPFWARRYSSEQILDNDALIGRLRYIFAHGVKEGLVKHPRHWPGLSSIPEIVDGIQRVFAWPQRDKKTARKNLLQIEALPCLKDYTSEKNQQRFFNQMLNEIAEVEAQNREHKAVLGAKKVLSQHPHKRPKNLKRSQRPWCHTTCLKLKAQFKKFYQSFLDEYRIASENFREGLHLTKFPDFAFRPPLPHGWLPKLA